MRGGDWGFDHSYTGARSCLCRGCHEIRTASCFLQHLHSGVNEVEVRRRPEWEVGELTGGEAPVGFDLQLLDLLNQQGDVLKEVRVLLQQPLNSELRVVPSARLHRQLLLENVDLRKPACTS